MKLFVKSHTKTHNSKPIVGLGQIYLPMRLEKRAFCHDGEGLAAFPETFVVCDVQVRYATFFGKLVGARGTRWDNLNLFEVNLIASERDFGGFANVNFRELV